MILWILLTAMVAIASVAVAIPLVRRYETTVSEKAATLEVLKDQLADIDAQERASAVSTEEANALRNEFRRRLLAEARAIEPTARPLSSTGLTRLAFGLAAVVALAATGLYATMGRPDAPGTSAGTATAASAPESQTAADVAGLIRGLEQRMAANPGDPEGWRMLGWSYFQTGRFGESANAYRRAVELAPNAPGFQSALGEALVQAAQGAVTPEAEAAFMAARKLDPTDARARYFLAVLKDQRGDRRSAIDDWVQLLNEAPADAPWAADLRQFVERLARESNIDLTGRLAPVGVAAAEPAPPAGPTPDQVRAAMAMPEQDRQAMVRGMVDGLAARLEANPRDVDGWIRLMRARMVLNEPQAASSALRTSLAAFGDAPDDQRKLRDAAKALNVPGA